MQHLTDGERYWFAHTVAGRRLGTRWVVAHMSAETARHAGHADILRELVDGVTGR